MASPVSLRSRILGGLWGHAVGDALGVPVEFCRRQERRRDPVIDMRGHGTHNQPPGTWSDDTSLTLCTIDALLSVGEDYHVLGQTFVRWYKGEIWTPHGRVFDIGKTTAEAIGNLARGVPPLEAGRDDEYSNGNGSLMRIAPVAIWFAGRETGETIEASHRFSALTHRHPRAQVGCALFCLVAQGLLAGANARAAIDHGWRQAGEYYRQAPFAKTLRDYAHIAPAAELKTRAPSRIKGSGYVVDALQASLWCLLTTASFREALLAAVNLGDDTDTTGAITGALAGLCYGVEAIPQEWHAQLARREDLATIFAHFAARCGARENAQTAAPESGHKTAK